MFQFKSIKGKMLVSFSIIIAMILFLGIYVFNTINNINGTTEDILETDLPLLIADEQLSYLMANRLAASRGYVLTGNSEYKELFDDYTERSAKQQEAVMNIGSTKEFEALIQRTTEWREYTVEKVFNEYDRGNTEVAFENLVQSDEIANAIMKEYEEAALNREAYIITKENQVLSKGKDTLFVVGGVAIAVILFSVAVAFITSNSISRPLRMVMERMGLVAEGNLSEKPLETKLKDEIGQLVVATNEMTENTRVLLNEVNDVSATVSSQSEELTQSAGEVKAGTEQISITMEDLATGAESQANHASDLSTMMESFVVKVMEADENGNLILQSSNEVLKMTNEGRRLMESSTEQMEIIDQIVHEAVQKVEGLDKHSQEISELVAVIQDIAGQTNLLALNAAIEAARAGEHGQGFSVVADEVRKLAEQSSESVTSITDIVNRIQSESSLVVTSLQESYKDVEQGTEQIRVTGKTFEAISSASTMMAERIQAVSNHLSDLSANSQEMGGSIQEIAAISEQSAAGVEQTAASSQQASSSMDEVSSSAHDLAELAEELNKLIQRFRL